MNLGIFSCIFMMRRKNIFYEKSNITKYFNKNSLFSFNLDDEFIKSFYKKIDCGNILMKRIYTNATNAI